MGSMTHEEVNHWRWKHFSVSELEELQSALEDAAYSDQGDAMTEQIEEELKNRVD